MKKEQIYIKLPFEENKLKANLFGKKADNGKTIEFRKYKPLVANDTHEFPPPDSYVFEKENTTSIVIKDNK